MGKVNMEKVNIGKLNMPTLTRSQRKPVMKKHLERYIRSMLDEECVIHWFIGIQFLASSGY